MKEQWIYIAAVDDNVQVEPRLILCNIRMVRYDKGDGEIG